MPVWFPAPASALAIGCAGRASASSSGRTVRVRGPRRPRHGDDEGAAVALFIGNTGGRFGGNEAAVFPLESDSRAVFTGRRSSSAGTRTTTATPTRSMTLVWMPPVAPEWAGASATIPATWSPGRASCGTVIVKQTETCTPGGAEARSTACPTQFAAPPAVALASEDAVRPPEAVIPLAA